jgi:hypothetical protein
LLWANVPPSPSPPPPPPPPPSIWRVCVHDVNTARPWPDRDFNSVCNSVTNSLPHSELPGYLEPLGTSGEPVDNFISITTGGERSRPLGLRGGSQGLWDRFSSIAWQNCKCGCTTNWSKPARTGLAKAVQIFICEIPLYFNIIGWGPKGSSPKHHSVSQQTGCLVPSIGYSTSVLRWLR